MNFELKQELKTESKRINCLIDLSYFIFYRYYATIFWFKLAHKKTLVTFKEKNPDLFYPFFEDKDFLEKYKKLFIETILKLKKKFIKDGYEISTSDFILFRDCPRKTIWRMKLFPEYKTNRDVKYKNENPALFQIFNYTYTTIVPKLKEEFSIDTLLVPTAEADDIVAITSKYICTHFPNRNVYIIASDTDYLQLIDSGKIIIMDLKNKIVNKKSLGNSKTDLLVKIISGDTADNIPKCFQKGRLGKKTALTLATNPDKLEERFELEPIARQNFNLNKTLIDFNEIPMDLQKTILNQIKEKIKFNS